jgi:hypothetical protein
MPWEVADKDFKLNDEIPALVATLTTEFEEKAGQRGSISSQCQNER